MALLSRVSMVLGSFGAVLLVACGGSSGEVPPAESDESATEPSVPKGGETTPGGTTATPPAASTPAPPPAAPPAKPLAEQCAASADALACVQCCVADMPAVDQTTCTCDANAACRADCATSLCTGKVPSFACGQCLLGKAQQIQACLGGLVEKPKACVKDAGCLQKPGAGDLDGLPLPFAL